MFRLHNYPVSYSSKTMSIKDTILNLIDRQTVPVEVPEWNITVQIQAWSARQRAAFMERFKDAKTTGLAAMATILSVVEADGKAAFSLDDLEKLEEKSGQALERIALAALKLNGLAADSIDSAKKV